MNQEANYFERNNVMHSDSSMKLMLDPNNLLREIEVFLRGYYIVSEYDEIKKETIYKNIAVGIPKANDLGVQSIMFWMKTKINPLISLGNITDNQYGEYLERTRRNFAKNLMINRVNYGISLANYTEIMDNLMECFEAYFTSSIKGGHRNAFTANHKVETREVIENDKKKVFGVI